MEKFEEIKQFVFTKQFGVGLLVGFILGSLHHYFGL